jgi:GAF domain-containing protein
VQNPELDLRIHKAQAYQRIYSDLRHALQGERDTVAAMATISCYVKQELGFFWVGFYRLIGTELVVGPYQGTLGCLRIPMGKGVCGAAAARGSTIIVPDVHAFAGHIACDNRSLSEIVVPFFDASGVLRGVLDVDDDKPATFDEVDAAGLEKIVALLREVNFE